MVVLKWILIRNEIVNPILMDNFYFENLFVRPIDLGIKAFEILDWIPRKKNVL